jgi:hypothetical protein
MKIFLISQVEDIISLLSQSQHTTNKTYREIAVGTVFGMPPQARNFIASDDSGLSHKPFPENKVKPEQRIDYLTHVSMGRFIHGPGLRPLATRFTQNILRSFSDLGIDDEWTELPDLYRFIQKCIFEASVPAMFGRQLIQRNSSFCEDFWDFDAGVPDLAKGLPKWAIPGAYKARDKCLETIKKHHLFLSQHQKDMIPDGNACGYNDLYGAEIIRYRHDMWSKMNAIDANARAAEDLGMIWG